MADDNIQFIQTEHSLPPHPTGDTRDIVEIMASEPVLGLCAGCGQFRENVGIRMGCGAYGQLCHPCWKRLTGGREFDDAGQPISHIPGNPLNL